MEAADIQNKELRQASSSSLPPSAFSGEVKFLKEKARDSHLQGSKTEIKEYQYPRPRQVDPLKNTGDVQGHTSHRFAHLKMKLAICVGKLDTL